MAALPEPIAAEPDIAQVPVMIDSLEVVGHRGRACKHVQGRPVVNSISLKEGEAEFLRQARLARRYGAAVDRHGLRRAGPGRHGRAQGRDRRARLPAADRAGRLRPRGHHPRPQHLRHRHGHRGARRLRASRTSRRRAGSRASCPARSVSGGVSATSRSRSAATTLCARRSMPCSCTTRSRPGMDMGIVNAGALPVYDDIDRRAAGARRGPRAQPAGGRHRADARGRRRATRPSGAAEAAATTSLARRAGRRAAEATRWSRASPTGSSRTPRRRGSPSARPLDVIEGPLMAGHGHRRRPVRLRADVPAPGRQERTGDEAGRRPPDPVHRGGASWPTAARTHGAARTAGTRGHGHGQRRRPRHRQEHRRRRARLQRLRDRRPGRDGARGHGSSRRREARTPTSSACPGLITPVARGDAHRRPGDGARGVHDPAAHRRRDDVAGAHGGARSSPRYSGPVVHVQDASRAVGVVRALLDPRRSATRSSRRPAPTTPSSAPVRRAGATARSA